MLFNSPLFLFLFLPAVLGLFYVQAAYASFRTALATLVLGSLIFYGYWNPYYLFLLIVSIAVNFHIGNHLYRSVTQGEKAKSLLWMGIAFNLALIGYFKYANFFVSVASELSGYSLVFNELVLPLGISFFTFQQITWLVDVYRGNAQRYDFLDYTQFVTFFPQLIAGPIVHHHEMLPQFTRHNMLARVSENIAVGFTLFFIGLFKKVVLADSIAFHASPVFDAAASDVTLTLYEAWVGALAYTLQLYFDFSGYSDMAIGLARMFGIVLPLNFHSPYKARSIIEFWRRWHMTLSRFLRDYLYIPLGGNRQGVSRRYFNIAITMLLGGLWHGAGWTFIVWGGLHGIFLVVNHGWRHLRLRIGAELADLNKKPETRPVSTPFNRFVQGCFSSIQCLASHCLVLVCIVSAWVVFRSESIESAMSLLRSMFGLNGILLPSGFESLLQSRLPDAIEGFVDFGSLFENELIVPTTALLWILLLGTIALMAPNSQQILSQYRPVLDKVEIPHSFFQKIQWAPNRFWALTVSMFALYTLLNLNRVSEFLYFQF